MWDASVLLEAIAEPPEIDAAADDDADPDHLANMAHAVAAMEPQKRIERPRRHAAIKAVHEAAAAAGAGAGAGAGAWR